MQINWCNFIVFTMEIYSELQSLKCLIIRVVFVCCIMCCYLCYIDLISENILPVLQVGEWIGQMHPEASVTLSHTVGRHGLLERENSSVLNESLKPLSGVVVGALRTSLNTLGLKCNFYLTQNNGTLVRYWTIYFLLAFMY